MKIFIGSDRIGYQLKRELVCALAEAGHEVADAGPFEERSVDYPEVALGVCRSVVTNAGSIGLLICSTGIGMAIAANKVSGVRAVNCTSVALAELARLHNDANVLCLGSGVVESQAAFAITEKFASTPFEGGKHARRVQMIDKMRE
jgi:ribose 5-phosphate isomerase B